MSTLPQGGPPAPGERLQAERLRRGMSVQKAADQLHLDPWVIEALEAGDHARLGPVVYIKGHLKNYAALLDLPAAQLLVGLQVPPPVVPESASCDIKVRPAVPAAPVIPWRAVAGFCLLIAVLIALVWLRPWQAPRSAVAPPPAAAAAAKLSADLRTAGAGAPDPADAANGAPEAAAAPPPAGRVESDGASVAADRRPPGAGHAQLRLSFSADSWVDVHDASGRLLFSGLGRANSVKSLAGEAPLRVHLGFASGVQIEINQHAVAIGPQFLAGDTARFDAGADAVLRADGRGTLASRARSRG